MSPPYDYRGLHKRIKTLLRHRHDVYWDEVRQLASDYMDLARTLVDYVDADETVMGHSAQHWRTVINNLNALTGPSPLCERVFWRQASTDLPAIVGFADAVWEGRYGSSTTSGGAAGTA